MSEPRESSQEARAHEILGLKSLGPVELRELKGLERDFALGRIDALARRLRRRRHEGDVALALGTPLS